MKGIGKQNVYSRMFRTLNLLAVIASATFGQDLLPKPLVLRESGKQSDFPALCVDAKGVPWIAYVEWDGQQDTLRLAQASGEALTSVLTIGEPGIIHQPAIAADGNGTVHVVWSQVNDQNVMDLKAAQVRDGKVEGDIATLASSAEWRQCLRQGGHRSRRECLGRLAGHAREAGGCVLSCVRCEEVRLVRRNRRGR
jgi:hypothetical protein